MEKGFCKCFAVQGNEFYVYVARRFVHSHASNRHCFDASLMRMSDTTFLTHLFPYYFQLLHQIYLDAIDRAERDVSIIRDSNYQYIIDAATSCWNDYEPLTKDCESVGVDSSWNKRSYTPSMRYLLILKMKYWQLNGTLD